MNSSRLHSAAAARFESTRLQCLHRSLIHLLAAPLSALQDNNQCHHQEQESRDKRQAHSKACKHV